MFARIGIMRALNRHVERVLIHRAKTHIGVVAIICLCAMLVHYLRGRKDQ
jgi:hypothetical protein